MSTNHARDITIRADDQLLECVTCYQQFLWSAGEQRFFALHGFTPPRRCRSCRDRRRAERSAVMEE
jgi:hypothetical protein